MRKAEALATPGRHADGGGLYLDISLTGSKSWVFLYRSPVHRTIRNGKPVGRSREMGLGSFGTDQRDRISLAAARALAEDARRLIRAGRDPLDERHRPLPLAVRIPTFGEMADRYVAAMEGQWRNQKHRAQWRMTLEQYARPMRALPVNEITVEHVLAVLKPIWQSVPETAGRLRGRIERVLNAAKAAGYRTGENPAAWRGHLENLLPRHDTSRRRHHPAMPWADIPRFMGLLRQRDGVAARAVEFLVLTCARSGEVRGALRDEFDLEAKVWTIPGFDEATGRRMKAGRDHRVPLVPRAVEIVEELMKLPGTELVFPGRRAGAPLSDMSLSAVLRRMKIPSGVASIHGFRSSFKDWASETTSFPNELSEAALAHVAGDKTERAYRRGDALERRRELMMAWAQYCDGGSSNVISLSPLIHRKA